MALDLGLAVLEDDQGRGVVLAGGSDDRREPRRKGLIRGRRRRQAGLRDGEEQDEGRLKRATHQRGLQGGRKGTTRPLYPCLGRQAWVVVGCYIS